MVNPARYDGHPEKLRNTVGFCLRLVEKCDAVVFTRLMGRVTAGVGKEVNYAIRIGRPAVELVGSRIKRRKSRIKYISRAATIRLYTRWRHSLLVGLWQSRVAKSVANRPEVM